MTKESEPVTAIMLYVMVDKITVTSTTNRAKYYAWKRNPATSFYIWDPSNIGRQVILREILQSQKIMNCFESIQTGSSQERETDERRQLSG